MDAGIQYERFQRTLQAATGSFDGSQRAMAFVTAEANRLGQSVSTMVPVFAQLTAATRSTVIEGERTRELFTALASAGQAVGLSTEATGRAMTGLIQIISQNAIQLDEFRTQFSSQIPGAMRETARALGQMGVTANGSIGEMLKLIERQKLSIDDLMKAVTTGLGAVARSAPDMSKSAEAAFAQYGNAILKLKANIASSGLLELLTNMAQTAIRVLNSASRVLGLAPSDELRQLGELQQKLSDVRKLREEVSQAPPPTALQQFMGRDSPETRLKQLDQESAGIEQKITALMSERKVRIDAATENERITAARNKAEADELAAIDAKNQAADAGRQAATARNAALIQLSQERVKLELAEAKQVQALRAQALETDYQDALTSSVKNKADQELVERAFAIRRLDMARQTALEEVAIEEEAALKIRDAKLKALDSRVDALTGPKKTDESEAAANKKLAAVAIERKTITIAAQTEMQEAASKRTEAEADYEKGLTTIQSGELEKRLTSTLKLEQRTAEADQKRLQASIAVSDAQIELVEARVDGNVLTEQEGFNQIRLIMDQRLDATRQLYMTEADIALARITAEVAATEDGQAQIADIKERLGERLHALDLRRETETQTFLNKQAQEYERFSERVVDFLDDIFRGLMTGTLNAVDFFKNLLIRSLSNIASNILGPLVASLSASVVGMAGSIIPGIGQALGMGAVSALGSGGSSGSGIGTLQGVGLLASMRTVAGAFTNGLTGLTKTMLAAGSSISTFFGGPTLGILPEGVAMEGVLNVGAGSAAGTVLSGLGGAAAIAGGIYGALNATNTASRAAYAASAAAGTAALASTALVAAGVIAASSGWTGIGLIAAAVTAIIGTVLEMVIKPAGPALAVGKVSGLGIGVEGNQLAVSGDLGSRVLRRDKVDPGVAAGVQAQMEEGITNAVLSIVQTINAVALNPAALLGPTNDALQQALQNIQPLNSANAKKMNQDITEQLRFINVAIVGGLLEPINLAFDQLRDLGTLEEQIVQLPGKTSGLLAIFTNLNKQLSDMGGSKNTDVLRQLSGVKSQVEQFGIRVANTAARVAETITNGIIETLQATVVPTLAGQITQFSGLMNESLRALNSLRSTQQILDQAGLASGGVASQIDRLAEVISLAAERISTEIVSGVLQSLATEVVPTLAGQIAQFSGLMNESLSALSSLRSTQQILDQEGLASGGVASQIDRLVEGVSLTSERISTEIVSGALQSLATDLDQVLIQPIRVQAVTVNGLFNDSLAALSTLWAEWHMLESQGINVTRVREQFDRLLGGMVDSVQRITEQAFSADTFASFLGVLMSIPEALANLNPVTQRIRQLGVVFSQIAGPVQQVIDATTIDLQTPAQRAAVTAQRMRELQDAITDAGDAIDQALPLYGQLAQAIQANAEAQIEAVNQLAQVQIDTVNAQADALVDAVNQRSDEWRAAWQDWGDTQMEALSNWAEDSTQKINDWTDIHMDALTQWVESSTQMINDWAEDAQTTASQLRTINQAILAEQSPAAQKSALEAQKASLEGFINTTGSPEAITELISVNQQLLALGKEANSLGADASVSR